MVETTTHGKIHEEVDETLSSNWGNRNLRIINFIPFWEALQNDDPTILNLTEEEHITLVAEYYKLVSKESLKEKRLNDMFVELQIIKNCLSCLIVEGYHDDTYEILKSLGLKEVLWPDNVHDAIERLQKEVDNRVVKYKLVRGMVPKEKRNKKPMTADEILGTMSLSLGFSIGKFNEVTVMEYISYSKSLEEKAKAYEKTKAKNNGSRKNRGS